MPKIVHFRKKCIGCNSCFEQAPSYWHLSQQDGKSVLIGAKKKGNAYVLEISAADVEENKRAARDCPARIIQVHD